MNSSILMSARAAFLIAIAWASSELPAQITQQPSNHHPEFVANACIGYGHDEQGFMYLENQCPFRVVVHYCLMGGEDRDDDRLTCGRRSSEYPNGSYDLGGMGIEARSHSATLRVGAQVFFIACRSGIPKLLDAVPPVGRGHCLQGGSFAQNSQPGVGSPPGAQPAPAFPLLGIFNEIAGVDWVRPPTGVHGAGQATGRFEIVGPNQINWIARHGATQSQYTITIDRLGPQGARACGRSALEQGNHTCYTLSVFADSFQMEFEGSVSDFRLVGGRLVRAITYSNDPVLNHVRTTFSVAEAQTSEALAISIREDRDLWRSIDADVAEGTRQIEEREQAADEDAAARREQSNAAAAALTRSLNQTSAQLQAEQAARAARRQGARSGATGARQPSTGQPCNSREMSEGPYCPR